MSLVRDALNHFLTSYQGIPFEWGRNDCLTFTNDAFRVMYGEGWSEDWIGRYMVDGRPMRRRELIKEFKFNDFNLAIDTKLQRYTGVPPCGSLVTTKQAQRWVTGAALGICTGTKAVFLSKQDVLYLPLDAIEQSWIKS